jgi:hypothetical protein
MKVFDLKPELVSEMSLVFKSFDGKEYAPRNPEAMVLAVKGGEKQSFISKAVDAIKKAYFPNDADFPVTEAADGVDNDGDGPEDYNALCSALCNVSWDLQQAMGISDDGSRSIAIKVAVDSFIAQFTAFIGVEKAGARHSKADKEHIAALQDAHKKMGDHLAALAPADEDAADGGKDDATEPDAKKADEAEPTIEPVEPIAEEPVAKAEEIEMTQEELDAKIAAAVAEGVAKATQVNAEAIEAAKAQARAEADASNAVALKAAQVEAEAANALIRSASIQAAAPAGTSSAQPAGESRLAKVLKAQLAQNPESHAF